MTFGDLFSGNFTWTELFRVVFPVVLVAAAYFAGYWHGRTVEQNAAVNAMDEMLKRIEGRR